MENQSSTFTELMETIWEHQGPDGVIGTTNIRNADDMAKVLGGMADGHPDNDPDKGTFYKFPDGTSILVYENGSTIEDLN